MNCIQYAFVLCILMPRIHLEISSQAGDFRCASQGDKSDQARARTWMATNKDYCTMSLDVTSCHLMLLVIWFWLNMCPVPKSCFMMFLCKVDGSFTFWWVPQRCFAWQRPASVLHDAFQAWQKRCGSAATHTQLEALSGRQNLFRTMMLVCKKKISSELRGCKKLRVLILYHWAGRIHFAYLSWASCPLLYTVRQKMVHVHFKNSQSWVLFQDISRTCVLRSTPSIFVHRHCSQLCADVCFEAFLIVLFILVSRCWLWLLESSFACLASWIKNWNLRWHWYLPYL